MVKSSRALNLKPFTPVRRLFLKFDLFASTALGKRCRGQDPDHDYSGLDPIIDTPPESPQGRVHTHNRFSTHQTGLSLPPLLPVLPYLRPACIALQNEDPSEDVVVITALDTIPFCCHEDLLTMSREQLVAVAFSLNTKLPAALQIDVSRTCPDSLIRKSIELIVGLRKDVPPAPKAIRSRSERICFLDEPFDINRSPPTSPLAKRSRSYDLYTSLGSPRLARLEEEEEPVMFVNRPIKKRKLSAPIQEDTRMTINSDEMMAFTPTPLPRILRTRSHPVASSSPTPKRVLRSHSQKLPDEMKNIKVESAFITTTRPKYRYRCRSKDTKSSTRASQRTLPSNPHVRTSTPKQDRRRPCSSRLSLSATESMDSNSIDSINPEARSKLSLPSSPQSTLSLNTFKFGMKRRRNDEDTDDDRAMAFGIDGMNMTVNTSDMDVCLP